MELAAILFEMGTCLVGFRNSAHHVISDFWSDRPHRAAELMSIVDARLRRVDRITSIYGGTDLLLIRAAAAAQRGTGPVQRGHWLVEAAEGLMGILVETEPQTAAGYLSTWAESQSPVLNLLAIHGWRLRSDESPESKLGWLEAHDRFVDDPRFADETGLLIPAWSLLCRRRISSRCAGASSTPRLRAAALSRPTRNC